MTRANSDRRDLGPARNHSSSGFGATPHWPVRPAGSSLGISTGQLAGVVAAARGLGLALPGPGLADLAAEWQALWLGPEQWMVMADITAHEDIAADLLAAFGTAASVTEQTGGWVCLDVSGVALPALFERLCPLDTRAMQPGSGTRTVIDHLGCYLIRTAPEQWRMFGPRSGAACLLHALTMAAQAIA